ncbi:MAG TPA: hypothetical protein PKB10_07205, partial [Tepidisphaeraceae bacterium]|nr:hypothetical protein [Tepidisphaeraceae bacterium]
MTQRALVRLVAGSTAAALFASVVPAMGQYVATTSFTGNGATLNDDGLNFIWNDAGNWNNGVPSATTLAVAGVGSSGGNQLAVTAPAIAYGLELFGSSDSRVYASGAGNLLTLTSTASAVDPVNSLAPAIYSSNMGSTSGEHRVDIDIQLGLDNGPNGVYTIYRDPTGPRIRIDRRIVQAPGTIAGLTIAGGQSYLRANTNSGNYLTNRYNFDGVFTVATGGDARVYNNIIPHGVGRPDHVINGVFRQSANNNTIILNSLTGSGQMNRNGGNDLAIGANNTNATFDGDFASTNTRLYKIGSGTQVLTNTNNAYGRVQVLEGTLDVQTVADTGVN